MSVADLFRQGQAIYRSLEDSSLSSGDTEFQRQLEEAITKFEVCARDVQSLSLFSDNETLDDLATGHLRFILLDAYLAELIIKRTNNESGRDRVKHRMDTLDTTTKHLRLFLNLCDNYGLISEQEKSYIERIVQKDGIFKSSGKSEDKTEVLLDAARRREEKIERYKREKAIKEKIDVGIIEIV
ncbi:TAP42-like protein [Syncephalis plumigaleata]|nr:TAP42-like protein [Syncephalis plumigaleata]